MRILRLKKYEAPARIVVLFLLFLTVTHSAWAQSTAYVSTYSELSSAIENESVNNIIVTANIDVPCETSETSTSNQDLTGASTAQLVIKRSLTLQSQAGSKYMIKRVAANEATTDRLKSLFSILGNGKGTSGNANLTENKVEVTFTNIIIDGGADWGSSTVPDRRTAATTAYGNAGRAMIDVFMGGTLNLEDGTVLQNGFTTYSINSVVNNSGSNNYGGAVRVEYHANYGGGTVNLKAGATIHDCSAQGGNTAGYGGALGAYNFARLNVYGGTIYNCSAANGGAIGCTWRSGSDHKTSGTINLFGGTIHDCYANKGGAILTEGTVADYLLGGTISNCTATTEGGAIAIPEKDTQVHIVDHSSGWLTISNCHPEVAGSASTGYYPCISINAEGAISTTPVYQVTFRNNNTDFAVLHVLQGDSLGEAFPAAPVNASLRFIGWYNGNTQVTSLTAITDNITVTAKWDFQGSGTANDPYLIPSAEAWDFLADNVSAGNTYSEKHFRQTGDFTITRMMGTALHADGGNQTEEFHTFNGTYDGYGHTITAHLNVTGERYAAPFHCIADGATIKNLIVTGYVSVSGGSKVDATRHPAGLVGTTRSGSCVIQNCRVSANVSGADYMGGILGHSWHADVTIRGCVYSGTLTATGTNYTGGLIGWGGDSGNVTINLADNLFTGSYSGSGKFHPVGVLCTIAGNTITVTNAYYTANPVIMNDNDGNSLVKNSPYKGTFVTPTYDKPANIGTPGAVYSVSGITVYSNGLAMNGQYYCGSPEYDYALTPTSVTIMDESKYVTTFYHGTLDYQLPEGALAYTAGKDGDKVVFYRIGTDSNVIPHDTAVIIMAEASALSEGKVTLTKLPSTDVTAKTGNILKGSDTDVTLTEGKVEGKTPYVLGISGGTLGFYEFEGSAIPAGKAYYVVD